MTEYAYEGPKRSSNAVSWSFESQNFPVDSPAPFTNPIDAIYQATIQAAFDRWSSISGLTFTQVADSPSAAIRIGFGTFASPYTIGETIVRSSGGYLPNDTVVRLLDPTIDPLTPDSQGNWSYADLSVTLLQVATHEIGHAIGLAHTTDPVTIMYPVATSLDRDLSPGDIAGINGLYPLYTVSAADPVQVEGNAGTTAYHFTITRHNDLTFATTVAYQIVGAPYPGLTGTAAAAASDFVGGALPSGQLTFAPGAASITLTVAVAGNTIAQPDQGFAVTLNSIVPSIGVTVRGTPNAVILDDDSAASLNGNTLSIYRFFAASDGTHFFTGSEIERNAIIQSRPDLVYEGAQFSALAGPADPAATAVYRFFDTIHGTHFYTSNTTERDAVIGTRSDLTYEGVGFYEHAAPQGGDSAVYRFFDIRSGTHFFTSAATERASILATTSTFTDEGVAFYAPASA